MEKVKTEPTEEANSSRNNNTVAKLKLKRKKKSTNNFIPELAFNFMRTHSDDSDSDEDYKPKQRKKGANYDRIKSESPIIPQTINGIHNNNKRSSSSSVSDSAESDYHGSIEELSNNRKQTKSKPKMSKKRKKKSAKIKKNCLKIDTTKVSYSGKMYFSSTKFINFDLLTKPVKFELEQLLPDELLIKIFNIILDSTTKRARTLIELSLVCEHWRQLIISTPSLWKTLDLSTFVSPSFPMGTFETLCTCNQLFSSVRSIDLTGWSGLCAERVIALVVSNSNFELESICVKYGRNISSDLLKAIVSSCSKIKTLDLSAITTVANPPIQNPFNVHSFGPFMEKCGPNLLELHLAENQMTSLTNCFDSIQQHCANLQVLDISNVYSFNNQRWLCVERFQQSCPQLRVLRAANNCFASQPSIVTKGFPLLQELSVPYTENAMSSHSNINDLVLEQLTKGSESLMLLDIRGLCLVTPHCLLKIPTWSLKHLAVSNCPSLQDDSMEMVFTKWGHSLVDVDLSFNKSDSCVNACVRAICEVDSEEPPLRAIQLRGSAVSFEMVQRLVTRCGRLESIDLQSCRSLPRGIKREFKGEDFKQFRTDLLNGKIN